MNSKKPKKNEIPPNRLRLVLLMKLFEDISDKNRTLSMTEIKDYLEENSVSADRRSIYKDIKIIREFSNYKIEKINNKEYKSFKKGQIEENLSEEEVQIIKNSILSAKFLSKDDTKKILNKIKMSPLRDTRLEGRVKADLAELDIFKNIKSINTAINMNKKIKFDYLMPDINMKLTLDKKACIVSPYAEVEYEDFYYMVGSYKEGRMSHYRIDRMKNIYILDESRTHISKITGKIDIFNVSDHMKKQIGGISWGNEESIRLKINDPAEKNCRSKLFNAFGDNVEMKKDIDGTYFLKAKVFINKEFISWILSFGSSVEIIYPKSLREEIKLITKEMSGLYK